MMRIHKYDFPIDDHVNVLLPKDARILKFLTIHKSSGYRVFLWALFDDKNAEKFVMRTFRVYGTGHDIYPIDNGLKYLDTVEQGPFIWHIFETTAW